IPALNRSGLMSRRMDMRSSEIGIRRSFGGTRFQLLKQVLWENLVLTIFGGIVGLVIVWLGILTSAGQLLTLLDNSSYNQILSYNITPEILYAPAIFIVAFMLCVVLNILSALVPAWFSLRRPVISNIE
ncbi:MAG: FtsX-like permease family protein, partial [Muribaculaceae bacterium]|nr:FtsX-like permease family protein [Muribaculaceae bacterium]